MTTHQIPLNQAQLSILQLFNREMTEQQMKTLKSRLVDFLDEMLQDELDNVMNTKNLTPDKIKDMTNWDNRTAFLSEIRTKK